MICQAYIGAVTFLPCVGGDKAEALGPGARMRRIRSQRPDSSLLAPAEITEWPAIGHVERWDEDVTVLAFPPGQYDRVLLAIGDGPSPVHVPIACDAAIVASGTMSGQFVVLTVPADALPRPHLNDADMDRIASALADAVLAEVMP